MNIEFKLNKELDKQMAYVFINKSNMIGGVDFSKNVTSFHPDLEVVKGLPEYDQKRIIGEYFDAYYAKNNTELEKYVSDFQNSWKKIERSFEQKINIIFKNPTKPDGLWTGYISVINCNPRFLHNKTFQVFYKHRNGSNEIAIHEILHFFFYDYAEKKFPELFKNRDKNMGIFWTLAELFNDVIQSLPEFAAIQGEVKDFGYPNHKKHQEYLSKLWHENPDIDVWIPQAFAYLTKTGEFAEAVL